MPSWRWGAGGPNATMKSWHHRERAATNHLRAQQGVELGGGGAGGGGGGFIEINPGPRRRQPGLQDLGRRRRLRQPLV